MKEHDSLRRFLFEKRSLRGEIAHLDAATETALLNLMTTVRPDVPGARH